MSVPGTGRAEMAGRSLLYLRGEALLRIAILSGLAFILRVDTVSAGLLDPVSAVPSDAERSAAMADARLHLEGAIAELPLGDQRSVRELLGESALSNGLAKLTRDARALGMARKYRDGVVETRLTLDVAGLKAGLSELLRDRGVSDEIITSELEGIDPRAAEMRLTVAGLVGPSSVSDSSTGDVPLGWETLGPSAVELAAEMAMLDARIKLVERIGEIVRVGDRGLSAQFLAEPESRERVLRSLPASIFDRPSFTIERQCMIHATLNAGAALAIVEASRVVGEDPARKGLTLIEAAPIHVTVIGTGVLPSARVMRRMGLRAPDERPQWSEQCLIVIGQSAVPRVIANQGSPVATSLKHAEMDAKRRMETQIARLPVRPGVTVRDVCGTDEPSRDSELEIERTIAEFLAGAYRSNEDATMYATKEDGNVKVRLSLPLRRLWRLVREQPVFTESGAASP